MRALVPFVLAGCAPQDAKVDGQWFSWLPANSSVTAAAATDADDMADELTGLADKATIFECVRGWDNEDADWEDGYIGPRQGDDYADPRFIGGACAPDDLECAEFEDEMDAECARINGSTDGEVEGITFFTEFQSDGIYGLSGKVEPWRTEALLNGEGAFQLTVHHDLGNGVDFRYAFSIDPDFAPVVCTADENGDPVIEYVDGAPWVEQWSADEEGYDIYYLNALSYQELPRGAESNLDYWSMPSEWVSGVGFAKFGSDEFYSYGDPMFNAISRAGEPDMDEYAASIDATTADAEKWSDELVYVAGAHVDGEPAFAMKIEDNLWRPIDEADEGLDGYVEVHSSWVRVKEGAKFKEGGSVKGDYQILFGGTESLSLLLVTGTFEVEDLKIDPWAYPVLEDELREENGTEFCGGEKMP